MKVKDEQALRRAALERGATTSVGGRPFNATQAEVRKPARLEKDLPVVRPVAPPPPVPPPQIQMDTAALAQALAVRDAALTEELKKILSALSMPPVTWDIDIVRGSDRLIERMTLKPRMQ